MSEEVIKDDKNEKVYTSDIAQTVDAASNFVRSNNPVLVCFIICISVFCALFYYQVNTERDRTKELVDAINRMNTDQKMAIESVRTTLTVTNEHLTTIEKQTYRGR